MRFAALLLLQALALSAGSGLPTEGRDACTGGGLEGGACAEGEADEAALLQSWPFQYVDIVFSSPAVGQSDEDPDVPSVDYQTVVRGVNATTRTVKKAVDLVNATLANASALLQAESEKLLSGFNLAKTAAEKTKFLIGEKAVKAVDGLVDRMKDLATKFVKTANDTADEAEGKMQELWSELMRREGEVLEKMAEAEELAQEIPEAVAGNISKANASNVSKAKASNASKANGSNTSKANASNASKANASNASLLEASAETADGGFWDWLKHLFGLDFEQTKSDCQIAKESLTAAGASAKEFKEAVETVDSQVGSDFIGNFAKSLNQSVSTLQSDVEAALSGLGGTLPAPVKSVVDKALGAFTSVATKVNELVEPAKKELARLLKQANSTMPAVVKALSNYTSKLDAKCEGDGDSD